MASDTSFHAHAPRLPTPSPRVDTSPPVSLGPILGGGDADDLHVYLVGAALGFLPCQAQGSCHRPGCAATVAAEVAWSWIFNAASPHPEAGALAGMCLPGSWNEEGKAIGFLRIASSSECSSWSSKIWIRFGASCLADSFWRSGPGILELGSNILAIPERAECGERREKLLASRSWSVWRVCLLGRGRWMGADGGGS